MSDAIYVPDGDAFVPAGPAAVDTQTFPYGADAAEGFHVEPR